MSSSTKTILIAAVLIVFSLILTGCGGPPPCSTEYLILSINNANSNGPGTDTINLEAGCVYQLGTVDNTVDGNNGTPSITSIDHHQRQWRYSTAKHCFSEIRHPAFPRIPGRRTGIE